MRFKRVAATGLIALIPTLTGCLTHTRSVLKTREPDVVYTATLENLLQQISDRYKATQTATLYVEISASTGGSKEGKVTESLAFSGYIFIQNPDHIRVILQLPVVHSAAMVMVSDGKNFKMSIPPKSCAIVGSDTSLPTQKGLYALRPAVILDSLLIPPLGPGQNVSRVQDSRIYEAPKTKAGIFNGSDLRKDLVEEPDYDVEFLSPPQGQVVKTLRVLHIGRGSLLPYQQDIYNADGQVETKVLYSDYQPFGGIRFPTKIIIERKPDDLGLTITIGPRSKFNQPLDADTFDLPIPSTYPVQNMDDSVSAQSNPCVNHGAPATSAATSSK